MALNPIQLTPNMDPNQISQAINDNFRQVESENRTKIIKDSNGNDQIIIGQNSGDNNNYGIYIGKITIGDGFISLFDDNGKEILRIGKLPNGVQGLAVARTGYSITEAIT